MDSIYEYFYYIDKKRLIDIRYCFITTKTKSNLNTLTLNLSTSVYSFLVKICINIFELYEEINVP